MASFIRRKVAPKSVNTDRHPATVSTAGLNRPAVQKNIRGIPGLRPERARDVFAAGYRQLWMQPKEAIKREINKSDRLK